MSEVASVQLVVGLEVHVELATRTKMFSWARNPACAVHAAASEGDAVTDGPNTLIDPVVCGLPGALPTINRRAVELSMMVGMALGCRIARKTRWDRKSYFYPDMPKNYQISQYDRPLCEEGAVSVADLGVDEPSAPGRMIGIIRAHLEEDAGKLLHEAPGGAAIDFSIVDLNRAGTPLLEIVTAPDFRSAAEAVAFCRYLRTLCVFLGATEGVLQRGHVRFEPNINCVLRLADGREVRTPVVEVKNLNSFKAVQGAIEFEHKDQPRRWREDGREMGKGAKSTRGWDDVRGITLPQREKEDAHDYRYFPDPDLLPLRIKDEWKERVRAMIPELPVARGARYERELGVAPADARALVGERELAAFFEEAVGAAVTAGALPAAAGKMAANLLIQSGAKRVNERAADGSPGRLKQTSAPPGVWQLGISARHVGELAALRCEGTINANSADELFGVLCEAGEADVDVRAMATERGMLMVKDDAALDAWVAQAIADNAKAAEDVRGGKDAAIGRLVGAAMKLAGGRGDAATMRARLLARLRG